MTRQGFWTWTRLVAAVVCAIAAGSGCHSPGGYHCCKAPKFDPCRIADAPVPKELNKVTMPQYVIEAPDILMIDAIRGIPLPPSKGEPLDVLYVSAKPGTVFETDPINGLYQVDVDGTINLGPAY